MPWWSNGQDSMLSLVRAWVQSLVSELRFLMFNGQVYFGKTVSLITLLEMFSICQNIKGFVKLCNKAIYIKLSKAVNSQINQAIYVQLLRRIQLFVTPWTPLSMGFHRQEYWSGLPFPSLGDFPDPAVEPASPALAVRFFTAKPPGKPKQAMKP